MQLFCDRLCPQTKKSQVWYIFVAKKRFSTHFLARNNMQILSNWQKEIDRVTRLLLHER